MFTDVVSWEVLFAPEQGAEITSTVLVNIEKAITNHGTIYSSQYSCDDKGIINAFLANGKQNPQSLFLFDKSQYFGRYERPLIDNFIQSLPPTQWAIGTSSVDDQILHSKIIAILYPDNTGWSFSGSFNLSTSAEKEFNIAHFIESRQLAEVIVGQIKEKFAWVKSHQPQPPVEERPKHE